MSSLVNAVIAAKDAQIDAERRDKYTVEDENIQLRKRLMDLEMENYYLKKNAEFQETNYQNLLEKLRKLINQ